MIADVAPVGQTLVYARSLDGAAMPPELIALIDKPWLLAIVLAVGAVCGIIVERFVEGQKSAERRAYWQGRNAGKQFWSKPGNVAQFKAVPLKGTPERAALDATEQLRLVMAANFTARPLLNKPERRILAHLDRILIEDTPGWRAMGQVSLGEILTSKDNDAYFAVNSKRVDLLIVDADCNPLHVIEFQGTGHYQGTTTAARDAVKKEALRRAGIGYVEVVSGDTPAELRIKMRKLAGQK
jgi:hypothetical protein